jgi:hypothetical protein
MFQDKFVAFIDVLGFKNLVASSEAGTGMPLSELLELLKKLGDGSERARFSAYGPTCCPMAPRIDKNMNFRVTQISDCAILSSEISPAGAINLISHCWGSVIELMARGIMCRGYIKRGRIYHTDSQVIGTGYQDAYAAESKVSAFKHEADDRGTPYIEVDSEVTAYIDTQTDACVKEMFKRMVKRDGETVVLFPFQRLQHSFIISGFGRAFEPDRELESNDNLRKNIKQYKANIEALVDSSNPAAQAKAKHYLRALDEQLIACDKTDEAIRMFSRPIPSHGRGV